MNIPSREPIVDYEITRTGTIVVGSLIGLSAIVLWALSSIGPFYSKVMTVFIGALATIFFGFWFRLPVPDTDDEDERLRKLARWNRSRRWLTLGYAALTMAALVSIAGDRAGTWAILTWVAIAIWPVFPVAIGAGGPRLMELVHRSIKCKDDDS